MAPSRTHSAGFGGLCAVVGALVTFVGVVAALVQRSRAARRDSWWERFVWVVDRSGSDLGGPLTISMLDQLTTTARRLNDADLIAFAERYTRHVYAESPAPARADHRVRPCGVGRVELTTDDRRLIIIANRAYHRSRRWGSTLNEADLVGLLFGQSVLSGTPLGVGPFGRRPDMDHERTHLLDR